MTQCYAFCAMTISIVSYVPAFVFCAEMLDGMVLFLYCDIRL